MIGSKSWIKQSHIFLKWGYVVFNFFIWALLRPFMAIWQHANISCVIFSWFLPLKMKISGKKLWVCFLQFFDPSTPKASNWNPTAHEYFTRNHSYKNSFKQCKISYNLIKYCRIWEFRVSKKENFLCFCTLSMYVTIK